MRADFRTVKIDVREIVPHPYNPCFYFISVRAVMRFAIFMNRSLRDGTDAAARCI